MANIQTSLTKSVILKPGESFTLPPGATLIASSDVNSLQSTCDIPELEELECYVFHLMAGQDPGNDAQPWSYTAFKVLGWRFSDVDYTGITIEPGSAGCYQYTIPIVGTNVDLLSTPLKAHADASGIYIDSLITQSNMTEGDDNGCHTFVLVRTVPSVAAKLELITSVGATFDPAVTDIPISYVRPKSHASMAGQEGVPDCPTGSIET